MNTLNLKKLRKGALMHWFSIFMITFITLMLLGLLSLSALADDISEPDLPQEETIIAEETAVGETPAEESGGEEEPSEETPAEEKTDGEIIPEEAGTEEESPAEEVPEENLAEEPAEENLPLVLSAASPAESLQLVSTSASASGDSAKGAIETLINNTLANLSEYTGTVTIELEDGLYEEDVILAPDTTVIDQYKDDFVLEIVAKDAGDSGTESAGGVITNCNFSITLLNVVFKGIVIDPSKSISVTKGTVDWYGTANSDTVNVCLNSNGSANVYTGDGDDIVVLTDKAGAKKALIDTGAGDDTVTITAEYAGVEVYTGEGEDTVNAGISTSESVSIYGGDNNDKILVDKYTGAATVSVDAGAGDDILIVRHTVPTIEKAVEETTTGTTTLVETINVTPEGKLNLLGGLGNDRFELLTALADTFEEVILDGGEGSDRLYLSGTLDSTAANPIEASSNYTVFHTDVANNRALRLNLNSVEKLTDNLKNKKTVVLTVKDDGTVYLSGALADYTDYVLTGASANAKNINIINTRETLLMFSNLLIDSDLTADDEGVLTVNDVTAENINVLLRGRIINVMGTVSGDNVVLVGTDGSGLYKTEVTFSEGAGELAESLVGMLTEMVSETSDTEINIDENAAIYALHDIDLLANVYHGGQVLFGIVINAEIADAVITVDGKLFAGYDRNGTKQNEDGDVFIRSSIRTFAGYNGLMKRASVLAPVALNFVLDEAGVTIGEKATVMASHNVRIGSSSEIFANSTVNSTDGSTAIGIAAAVIINDVYTNVNGIIVAGGDVYITADGNITDTADVKPNGTASSNAAYVAVSVVEQDSSAVLGKTASINAAGNITVRATAKSDIETSVAPSVKALVTDKVSAFPATVGTAPSFAVSLIKSIISKIPFRETARQKKALQKALEKIASSDYTVRTTEESNDITKGSVDITTETNDKGATVAKVTVTPESGWWVSEVSFRYLKPAEDHFTYDYAKYDAENEYYYFILPTDDAVVYVEYITSSSSTGLDLFDDEKDDSQVDIGSLVDDATDGSQSVEDELSSATGEELDLLYKQCLNGAILTEQEDSPGVRLSKTYAGEILTFVANPAEGYTLKEKSLRVTYYIIGTSGKEVKMADVVTADESGDYKYTVPENILTTHGLTVEASFEEGTDTHKKNTKASTQVSGSIAVSVVNSDGTANVEDGANLEAAGDVYVYAVSICRAVTTADGSAVTKSTDSSTQKIKPTEKTKKTTEYIPELNYMLRIRESENGTATGEAIDKANTEWSLKPVADDGYILDSIRVRYIDKNSGLAKTVTDWIEDNGNGTYTLKINTLSVKTATEVELFFDFKQSNTESEEKHNVYAGSYLIRNAVSVETTAPVYEENGEEKAGGKLSWSLNGKTLTIKCLPVTEKGYTIYEDGDMLPGTTTQMSNISRLYITYKDVYGNEVKRYLYRDVGADRWTVNLDDNTFLSGTVISICGIFEADFREVNLSSESGYGTVTTDLDYVKYGDKLTISVAPESGYFCSQIKVTYINGTTKEENLSLIDGKATFSVPNIDFGKTLDVFATFTEKNIAVKTDNGVTASEKKVSAGDTVILKADGENADMGKKVTGGQYTYINISNESKTIDFEGDNFILPADAKDAVGMSIQVTANLVTKDVNINTDAVYEQGEVTAPAFADVGETLYVTAAPKAGYRVKEIFAKIYTNGYYEQVALDWVSGNVYSIVVPDLDKDPEGILEISIKASFEEGSDGGVENGTRIGAGVAVTVADSDADAAIRGTVSANNITARTLSSGGASTKVVAGYSNAKNGVAGAIGVQVASFTAKSRIYPTAVLTANNGISLNATQKISYSVEALASGGTGSSVGIGAGIAVGVNAADAIAALADGATVDTADGSSDLKVVAFQKAKDKVSASAGSAGGTSVTPAAAVDVFGSSSRAFIGKLNTLKNKETSTTLEAGNVSLNAANNVSHSVTADASSAGTSAAVGGAFAVSVLADEAKAELHNSVTAQALDVIAKSISTQSSTATASATGGAQGSKTSTDSKGSADAQTDKLLSGGSRLAGKNGSSSLSGGKVAGLANGRQQAQTAEGSVAGAASVAVNIQENISYAAVADGVDVLCPDGDVSIVSQNLTKAELTANSSAAKSDKGLGVGVAVNTVNLSNIAYLGDGKVTAENLTVRAEMASAPRKIIVKNTVRARTGSTVLEELIGEYITELCEELGINTDGLDELITRLASEFVEGTLEGTELKKFLDTYASAGTAALKLEELVTRIKAIPENALQPLTDLKEKIIQATGISVADLEKIFDDVLNYATVNLFSDAAGLAKSTGKAALDKLVSNLLTQLTNVCKGNSFESSELTEGLEDIAMSKIKGYGNAMFEQFMSRLTTAFPLLDHTLRSELMEVWNRSLSENIATLVESLNSSIKAVVDYDKIIDYFRTTDIASDLKTRLKSGLASSGTALTQAALDKLSETVDTATYIQDIVGRHIVSTIAISGAGAKSVAVAGSVAVTVFNSNTKAELAEGNTITVTGLADIAAVEDRKVVTTATAATSEDGSADENSASGADAQEDNASDAGSSIENESGVTVDATVGGTVGFDPEGKNTNRVLLTVDDSHIMPDEVSYELKSAEGDTTEGTVQVKKDGEVYYISTSSINGYSSSYKVAFHVVFEEDLHTLVTKVMEEDKTSVGNAVAVSVDGREADTDELITAVKGDTVRLKVTLPDGKKIAKLTYAYEDSNGDMQTVDIGTIDTQGAGEIEYIFVMPDFDIDTITASFVDMSEEERSKAEEEKAANVHTDSLGRSIGVGASFAFTYGDADVAVEIGKRTLTAGTILTEASSAHTEKITAVAGTDPLASYKAGETKDVALDAAVSLNMLDTDILVSVANGAKLTTKNASGETINEEHTAGELFLHASENAVTFNRASGFASGSSTAVGAAVAVNLSETNARVCAYTTLKAAGKANVSAVTSNQNTTEALATAMGADIQRALNKLSGSVAAGTETANKLSNGTYFEEEVGKKKNANSKNETANKINKRLNDKKEDEGEESSNNLSLSENVLRFSGAKTGDTTEAAEESDDAAAAASNVSGSNLETGAQGQESVKVQVAAAVGVSVGFNKAIVTLKEISAADDITVLAENHANFSTLATGAAMSLSDRANSVAAAVAVVVRQNDALVTTDGKLVSNNGDISVESELTGNMDGFFRGNMSSQAIAGSVSGRNSTVSLAGAVATIVNRSRSIVELQNTAGKNILINGANVKVEASDQTRIAMRAGAVSASKGSNVGMGASFAVLVSAGEVKAILGKNYFVSADSFVLNAEKKAIADEDYVQTLDLSDLITNSSNLTESQRAEAKTGIIDFHKNSDGKSYTVNVRLSSADLVRAVSLLNFLSSQNYYVDAVSGSVMGGEEEGILNGAGSFSVVHLSDDVRAEIGMGSNVETTGDVTLKAENAANTRIISGAVSVGNSSAAGLSLSFLKDASSAKATLGEYVYVAGANYSQSALVSGNRQLITVAVAGSASKAAAGGTVNVLVLSDSAVSEIADSNQLVIEGTTDISAKVSADTMLITVDANVAASEDSIVAAGGNVSVIADRSEASVNIGTDSSLESTGNLSVNSGVSDKLIAVSASVSGSSSVAVAGNLGVLVNRSSSLVEIEKRTKLISSTGNISVNADSDNYTLNASLTAAASKSAAVGADIHVNISERTAHVILGTDPIGENDTTNVTVNADQGAYSSAVTARDYTLMAALNAGIAVSGASVTGNIPVIVSKNAIENIIGAQTKITAMKDSSVTAEYDSTLYVLAGSLAVGGGSAAVGATVVVDVRENVVRVVSRNNVTITVGSNTAEADFTAGSQAKETAVYVAIGAAGASSAAVSGAVVTLVNENVVLSDFVNAVISANGSVCLYALDDAVTNLCAGSLSDAGSVGVGAAVVTMSEKRRVEALAGAVAAAETGIVEVRAEEKNDMFLLAASISGGVSVSVGVGSAVLVYGSTVNASIGGTVSALDSENGIDKLILLANSDTKIKALALSVAASGSVAVTPEAVVIYFTGNTKTSVADNSIVRANNVSVKALSEENIDVYVLGAAGSGSLGVSGGAAVVIGKLTTTARIGKYSALSGRKDLELMATDTYSLLGVSGAFAASGVVGVAVAAVVSVLHNTVTAIVDSNTSMDDFQKVQVYAENIRDVNNYTASLSGTGSVGAGVSVLVFVAGSHMSQDAADMLMYGNAADKNTKASFDPDLLLQSHFASVDAPCADMLVSDTADLGELLSGDGQYESSYKVGSGNAFDANSGADYDSITAEYDEDNPARGENAELKDSEDVAAARTLGTVSYDDTLKDTVSAFINESCSVKASSVSVTAKQITGADLVTASLAGSGVDAIGAGVAVAVLHSNVNAVADGTYNCYNLTVEAVSEEKEADKSDFDEFIASSTGTTGGGIRAVSVTGSIAALGVSVSTAVLRLDNVTQALLKGAAQGYTYYDCPLVVHATHSYEDVLAATLTASLGFTAVGASVAVLSSEAAVSAQIAESASVSGFRTVEVISDVTNQFGSYASTIGIGYNSGNAAVAVASDSISVKTYVSDNALKEYSIAINGTNAALLIKSILNETVNARIIGVSLGGIALNTAAAVAKTKSAVETKLGTESGAYIGDFEATHNILYIDVSVLNDIISTADARVYSVSAGGFAANGTVLLAFNDTKAAAEANIAEAYILSMLVKSTTKASAVTKLDNLSVGMFAGGVNVCYTDLAAQNISALNVSGKLNATNNLVVTTGDEGETNFTAESSGLTGEIGVISVSVIPVIVRNRAVNTASVVGEGSADYCKVTAQSNATAQASVEGIYAGEAMVGVSFVQASLEAVQSAILTLSGHLMQVESLLNANKAEGEIVSATVIVNGGSIESASADVARAYNRSQSLIKVTCEGYNDAPTLINTAHTDATAKVTSNGFSFNHIGVEMAFAYNQAVIETITNRPGKATTDYSATATAVVDPSLGGVKVGSLNIGGNTAVAKSTAKATTGMDAYGIDVSGGSISVKTTGDTHVLAKVNTPEVSLTVGNVAVNVVIAELCTEQYAYAKNMKLSNGKTWEVLAELSRSDAHAILGGNGGGGTDVKLAGLTVNYARALSDVTSVAWTDGLSVTAAENAEDTAYTVMSTAAPVATAKTDTNDFSAAMISIGVNVLKAETKGYFKAYVLNAGTLEGVNNFTVRVDYTADAETSGGVSGFGIRGTDVTVNEAEAVADTEAYVSVKDVSISGLKTADIGINGSHVTANAYIDTISFSISSVSVGANETKADVTASQTVTVIGFVVNNGTDVTNFSIENIFNTELSNAAAQAKVGSAGGTNISVVNGNGNTAYARVNPTITTTVKDISGEMPDAAFTVSSSGNVISNAASYNSKGLMLANISVMIIESVAEGSFSATFETAAGQILHVKNFILLSKINASSDAEVDGSGTLWSGLNIGVNSVDSNTSTSATVELGGSGSLVAEEDIGVGVRYENISAKAIAHTAKSTVSGAKVAVNHANSNVSANNAVNYTASKNADNIIKARKLGFLLESKGISSYAEVGSTGGTNISGIDVTVHKADARSATVNTMTLNGTCPIEVNVFQIQNYFTGMSNTEAKASNGTTEIALGTFGNLEAVTNTNDSLLISADGLSVTADAISITADNKGVLSAASTTNPGGVSVVNGGSAKASAYLGTKTDPETVSVRILNSVLNAADSLDILANNNVEALAYFDATHNSYSLASIKETCIPTVSYHDTEIVLEGSELTANKLSISTVANGRSQSEAEVDKLNLIFNADTMKGCNEQVQNSLVRIKNAVLKAKNTLSVTMDNNSDMQAISDYEGASIFATCNSITASNKLTRKTIMELEGSTLTAAYGMDLLARSGYGDDIYTFVYGSSDALGYADGNAEAILTKKNTTGITVKDSELVTVSGDLSIKALYDGSNTVTESYAHAGAIAVEPKAKSTVTDTANTYVNISGSDETTQIMNRGTGSLNIHATTDVQNNQLLADTEASGVGATSYSDACMNFNLIYCIKLSGKVNLSAVNTLDLLTGMEPNTIYNLRVYADLSAVGGKLNDNIYIKGLVNSLIKKYSDDVTASAPNFTHKAMGDVRMLTSRDFNRGAVIPITSGAVNDTHTTSTVCDFCQNSSDTSENTNFVFGVILKARKIVVNDEKQQEQEQIQEQVLKTVTYRLRTYLPITEKINEKISETVADVDQNDVLIQKWFTMQIERGEILQTVLDIYDLDVLYLLDKELIYTSEDVAKCYVRSVQGFNSYMLPNGSGLYTDSDGKLFFVDDTVSGTMEDGTFGIFTIVNILDKDFGNEMKVYLNEEVTLDLNANEITIPANNFFSLYADEVSGAWMQTMMENVRFVYADPELVATDDYDLIVQDYEMVEGFSFWKEENGIEYYWIGLTPEQTDEEHPWLYFLALDTQNDSYTVWRTDAEKLDGEGIIPVSLYIFRSLKEDAAGKVVYYCLAYDVPEGEESTLYLSTGAPIGEPSIQEELIVALHACTLKGLNVPVSYVNKEYILLQDLSGKTTGRVLNIYSASWDGENFESSVLSVNGRFLDRISVIVKPGQYVWADEK